MNEQLLLEILTKFAQHLVDGPPKKMSEIAGNWAKKNVDIKELEVIQRRTTISVFNIIK